MLPEVTVFCVLTLGRDNFIEDSMAKECCAYSLRLLQDESTLGTSSAAGSIFTEEEKEVLRQLPNKECTRHMIMIQLSVSCALV